MTLPMIFAFLVCANLFFQVTSSDEVLTSTAAVWQEDLVAAVVAQDWLGSAKIIKSIWSHDFSSVQLYANNRRIVAIPDEAVDQCRFPISPIPLVRYSQQVGEIRACRDMVHQSLVAVGSSTMWLTLVLMAIISWVGISPLHAYRVSLLRLIGDLENLANSRQDHGLQRLEQATHEDDEASMRIRELVRQVIEMKLAEQRRADELSAEKRLLEFARQVAHDIRSPLSALTIFVKRARLQTDMRTFVVSATTRIHDIANDLLVRANSSPILRANTPQASLSESVQQIGEELRIRFSDSGLIVDVQAGDHDPALPFDIPRIEFERVLSSLASNAAEAASQGGAGRIALAVRADAKRICVEITDDGPGIPIDLTPHLGKMVVPSSKPNGSGIGVYNAANMLRAWKGELAFESDSNGTTARIFLPLA